MKIWKDSVENLDDFWLKAAKELCYWKKEPTKGLNWKSPEKAEFTWFEDSCKPCWLHHLQTM